MRVRDYRKCLRDGLVNRREACVTALVPGPEHVVSVAATGNPSHEDPVEAAMTERSRILLLLLLTACSGAPTPGDDHHAEDSANLITLEWSEGDRFHVAARYREGAVMAEERAVTLATAGCIRRRVLRALDRGSGLDLPGRGSRVRSGRR